VANSAPSFDIDEGARDSARWAILVPGSPITVVKLAPDGTEAARYPGEVVAKHEPGAWVIVRATWTYPRIDLDGLSFLPGDQLLEWFSPDEPFNAFAIVSPEGTLRGWYANVAHPAYLLDGDDAHPRPVVVWHDLYLDLIAFPDGRSVMRDEDELHDSRLSATNPRLFRRIQRAGEELQRRSALRLPPFLTGFELAKTVGLDSKSDDPQTDETKSGADFVYPH
jgi:hypothetical protein